MFNNFRAIIFYCILYFSYNHIHSTATTIPYPGTFRTTTTITPPVVRPAPQSAPTPINYTNIAMASQVTHQHQATPSNPRNVANIGTEEHRKYKNSYIKQSQERTNAQLAADNNIKQATILKNERAQIRTEKEIFNTFIDIRHDAFTKIESESVRPIQWGDRFPITKSFFEYIGWREDVAIIERRIKIKAEVDAKKIACEHVKSVMLMALLSASNQHPEQTMKFFIDNGMNCDLSSSDENNEPKYDNAFFTKNTNNNAKSIIDGDHTKQLDDIIYKGEQYKQYVFVDDNGQYTTGYLESYDGQRGQLFISPEYLAVPTSRTFQQIQQFHAYHGQSVQSMRMHALSNTVHYQKFVIDAMAAQGRMTPQQAMEAHKNIEYTSTLRAAQAAVKQYHKMQNPSFFRKTINYFSRKSSQSTTPNNASKNTKNQTASSSHPTTSSPTHTQSSQSPTHNTTSTTHQTTEMPTNNPSTPSSAAEPAIATSATTPTTSTTITETSSATSKSDTQKPHNLSPEQLAAVAHVIHNQSSATTPSATHTAKPQKQASHGNTSAQEVEVQQSNLHDQWQANLRQQQLEAQDAWMHNNVDTNNMVNDQEKNMLQCMHNSIINAENDTTVEIAQSGLRSWQQAQDATSDDEGNYHLKAFHDYHRAIAYKTPSKSIAQQALPIRYHEVDDLLQDYKNAIKIYHDTPTTNQQSVSIKNHFDRLTQRAQALAETKTQCNLDDLPYHTYDISPQARGFMMANNMNYAAFDGAHVTNFQHCLTQEIVEVIESCASTAQNYPPSSIINQLATHNCNLAISAQQLCQASYVPQAVAIVDLSHFFNAYTQFLVDSTQDVSLGIVDGTVHALQKWGKFLQQLGCHPRQTIGKITNDCAMIGKFLYNIVETACEFMPHAYLNDINQDMLDNFHTIKMIDSPTAHAQTSSRMMQRTQRNAQCLQEGLYGALHIAQEIVDTMMKNSLRQNVAYGTEIIVDNMITAKATDCLVKIATCIGTPIVQAAETLSHNIPSHLHDATPMFATNAGQFIAITEAGENIGAAVAAQVATNNAENIIKNIARTKALNDKINEITRVEKEKNAETIRLNKELAEVTSATEIRSTDRLKKISNDIPQVEEFRKYTDDFRNLEKLKPEEIMYLNVCDWLEPQARAINAEIKAMGGIKIIDPVSKTEVVIEKFDIFHSLLGEMKPETLANRTSGGHLFISELRAATLDIGEIKTFGNGFLDMQIKYAGKLGSRYKDNSYFPKGTTVRESLDMIKDAILKPKNIEIADGIKNQSLKGFIATNQQDQKFIVLVGDKIAQFYPYKPKV
ncbi:MAG: hypothetical protein Q8Q60_00155 [Candidatus Chromulinivorax sp.]|nr:hypothetical protein [Candidatus Chromulinivorax sp.]